MCAGCRKELACSEAPFLYLLVTFCRFYGQHYLRRQISYSKGVFLMWFARLNLMRDRFSPILPNSGLTWLVDMSRSNDVYVELFDGAAPPPLSARGHVHGSSTSNAKKRLLQASAICAVFMVVEIIAGFLANSLALMTDASHLLSDLSSFLISLFALWVSDLPGTHQLSFGYHRAEILGALISVLLIWALTFFLIVEALHRLARPQLVNGKIMFVVALVGTVANIFMTYILGVHSHGIGSAHTHEDEGHECHGHSHHHDGHKGHLHSHSHGNGQVCKDGGPDADETSSVTDISHCSTIDASKPTTREASDRLDTAEADNSLSVKLDSNERRNSLTSNMSAPLLRAHSVSNNVNLRAAYLHALGDLIQNIGVLFASALIWWRPDWSIADPICTFIFSLLVLTTTISILKEAANVLMEGTPSEIDLADLREALVALQGVSEVHDLHVWSLSVGKPSLACHMVIGAEEEARRVLRQATYICQKDFGILHTTIQIDFSANKLACDTDAHSKCH